MRYRRLGSGDLEVSVVSLGSWLTYGGGVADDAARAGVDAAFDAGINLVDTANVYRSAPRRSSSATRSQAGRAIRTCSRRSSTSRWTTPARTKGSRGAAPPEGSRATSERMGRLMGRWLEDDVLRRVERLARVAEGAGHPLSQLALAWVLREENIASAIVGASRPEQVRENAAAADVVLDAETAAELDAVLRS